MWLELVPVEIESVERELVLLHLNQKLVCPSEHLNIEGECLDIKGSAGGVRMYARSSLLGREVLDDWCFVVPLFLLLLLLLAHGLLRRELGQVYFHPSQVLRGNIGGQEDGPAGLLDDD